MKKKKPDQFDKFDKAAYRERIKLMRKACGNLSQTEFTLLIGIAYKTWSHYEQGYAMPKEAAFVIHERLPGMSIEWLWFGKEGNLSPEWRVRLKLARHQNAPLIRSPKR
jgi:DNA-binding XRE family transcriptional regulator